MKTSKLFGWTRNKDTIRPPQSPSQVWIYDCLAGAGNRSNHGYNRVCDNGMIFLKDKIDIQTTPKYLFDWLANLKDYYIEWHHDHVACMVLKGGGLEIGTVVYCEEYLHGKLHKIRFRATKVIPERRFEYKITPFMQVAFEVHTLEQGVRFITEISFGIKWSIIDSLVDNMLGKILIKQTQALKIHMTEERINLKQTLETRILVTI